MKPPNIVTVHFLSAKWSKKLFTINHYELQNGKCIVTQELSAYDGKHLYQWTAIDECTRIRFIYGFEEHTPENSVKFFKMLQKIFPFKIQTIQTDNGTEFTYKYISDTEVCPFDIALKNAGVQHKLIPPRTPWHNGKVERSHRNDQRYFYNWEKFASVKDLNRKLKDHLHWSNRKPMRTLGGKSPLDLLREILSNA